MMEDTVLERSRWAMDTLRRCGNERTAMRSRSYFKPYETVRFFGISTQRIREIERELYCEVSGRWEFRDAVRFCDGMIRSEFLEAKTLGILLLARFRKSFRMELPVKVEKWLSRGLCGNWASTDAMAAAVLAPFFSRFPGQLTVLLDWSRSDSLWVRRAAAVALVPACRKGEHLDLAFRLADALLGDAEDLIHKAVGWLLREAGKSDWDRLEAYLLARGSQIPRTTLRYAVEKFPLSRRASILAQTRAARVRVRRAH